MKSTLKSKELTCEWCSNKPRVCFESKKKKRTGLIGTNIWFYSCYTHRKQLEELAESKYGKIIYLQDKVIQKGY